MRPIDGDELFEVITEEIESVYKQKPTETLINYGLKIALRDIECQPTIKIQPIRRGQWEEIEDYDGDTHYGCTACGAEFYLEAGTPEDNGYYYCPRCGVDMRNKLNLE